MRYQFPQAVLAALSLAVFPLFSSQSFGNHWRSETAYVAPSSTVVGIPTTYVLPTTYTNFYPASTVLPTVYSSAYVAPTYTLSPAATVVPTYYETTSYLLPRRFLRRPVYASTAYYVPTTYYPTVYAPTAYYYPTVYDYPVVATAETVCCGSAPSQPPAASLQQNPAPATAARTPKVVESTPAGEPSFHANDGTPSNVEPAPATAQPADPAMPSASGKPANEQDAGSTLPPPANNLINPETSPPNPSSANETLPLPPVQPDETSRRQSQKPVLSTPKVPQVRVTRNVLAGKVLSSESGQPEEGVKVTVSSRAGAFVDRSATTDVLGRYAVRLPDGDWTVKVSMPSGRVYSVSQITVSGGQITDDVGRNVPSLTITR